MKSILDKNISMCRRANEPANMVEVNLLKVLTTNKYRVLAEQCHRITDKKERQQFKLQNVPVITVGGRFKSCRKECNLMQHSGLLCLDLDGVKDITTLKEKVSKLPFAAYCSRSISGTGLFAIVPIPESTPEEHKQRYEALERYFIQAFGITGTIDPMPKSVAAARYVSFDSGAYFNHNAAVFDQLSNKSKTLENKPKKSLYRERIKSTDYDKVWDMVDMVQSRKLDFAPDYDTYLRVAFSLANGLGESGRNAFHAVCQYSGKYEYTVADNQFTNALKTGSRITLGTFFQFCKDYGLQAYYTRPIPAYRPKITGYPKSWDGCTSDYTDKWQLINHLVNGGMPLWLAEAKASLLNYEAGFISGDEYLDALQLNFEGSGLSGKEYVKQTNLNF